MTSLDAVKWVAPQDLQDHTQRSESIPFAVPQLPHLRCSITVADSPRDAGDSPAAMRNPQNATVTIIRSGLIMCDCSQFTGRARDMCEGAGRDGRPDPRRKAVEVWRSRNCQRSTVQDGSQESQWNPSQPSRGLGDTIAKVTHAIGLDVVAESIVKAVTGKGCGCKKRQAVLNAAVPYRSAGESGPS